MIKWKYLFCLPEVRKRNLNKPYLLFKTKHSPFWYAQVRLPDGTISRNKSTGKENKTEAERVVMGWVVNGCVPERTSRTGKAIGKQSFTFITVLNYLKTNDLSSQEIDELIEVMKSRKIIQTAVRTNDKGDRDAMEYLIEFWTRDKSPYLREMELKGHSSTNRHILNMRNIIKNHWRPLLEGKLLGEITRDDVNKIFMAESTKKLTPKTVKAILQAVTIPMKWAHLNGMTENNCYSGIISPKSSSKKRIILSLEQTISLFDAEWDNDRVKLACLIACFTGMRQGEILALQVRDIGEDRIFIRHSYSPYEGLKTTKNGEEREILIPLELKNMILNQATFNPWGCGPEAFIFFSPQTPDKPLSPKRFNRYLRRALESIGYPNPDEITFHSFRHEWCTNTLSDIGDQRICMIGSGHKTESVFNNYANHIQKEIALNKIAQSTEHLFSPILKKLSSDAVYVIHDDESDEQNNGTLLLPEKVGA